jgi:hypothetical protein
MGNKESTAPVVEHFSELEDPRRYNRRHYLRDILVIAICAAISGANGWEDVAQFGKLKMAWLKGTLGLELPVLAENAHPFENPSHRMNNTFGFFALTR